MVTYQIDRDKSMWINQAIASFAVAFCQINGVKNPRSDWFDPIPLDRKKEEAKQLIGRKTAKIFLELVKNQEIPPWAIAMVDLDLIKVVADGE